jgi:hypothetical protein
MPRSSGQHLATSTQAKELCKVKLFTFCAGKHFAKPRRHQFAGAKPVDFRAAERSGHPGAGFAGLLVIQSCEMLADFLHRQLVVELAVAVGQISRRRPRAANMPATDTTDRRCFVKLNPIFHAVSFLMVHRPKRAPLYASHPRWQEPSSQ